MKSCELKLHNEVISLVSVPEGASFFICGTNSLLVSLVESVLESRSSLASCPNLLMRFCLTEKKKIETVIVDRSISNNLNLQF